MLRTGRVLPSVSVLSLACALLALPAAPARAVTLVKNRTASGVDWVSAGVGGIPSDTADITLAGVTGPVTKAYLYWDGININGTIAINGNSVTGTSLGDTSTNCWGPAPARPSCRRHTVRHRRRHVLSHGAGSAVGLRRQRRLARRPLR